jgi:hypothetical protein
MLSHETRCVQLSDESLTDCRRLRDLLGGAMASRSIDVVKPTVSEAFAISAQLVDRIERYFAWQHEQDRQMHAQASKHVNAGAV